MFLKTPIVSELRTCRLCGVIIMKRSYGSHPHNLVYTSSTAAPLPLLYCKASDLVSLLITVPKYLAKTAIYFSSLFQRMQSMLTCNHVAGAIVRHNSMVAHSMQTNGNTGRGPHEVKIPWTIY